MMKKFFSVLLLNAFLVSFINAKPLAEDSGWEFTLSLNAGYVSGQSNFSVGDDNEVINSLDNKSQSEDSFIAYPFARVQYTSEDLSTQFFLGNSRKQISISQFQYEIGAVHQFANKSTLTAAYFPELPLLNDVWADPFLVGQKRVETEQNTQGARIEWGRIAGGPITLKYAYARSRIEDENSGDSLSTQLSIAEIQALRRDSDYHRVAVETMFPIASKVFLKPTLQYTARLADGDANSYEEYDFQLGLLIFKGRHTSITTFNVGATLYDETNPIFNRRQDSVNVGIFSVYSYEQAFNWKPVTFSLIAGYSQKNADISFYDEQGLILLTGLAYTF